MRQVLQATVLILLSHCVSINFFFCTTFSFIFFSRPFYQIYLSFKPWTVESSASPTILFLCFWLLKFCGCCECWLTWIGRAHGTTWVTPIKINILENISCANTFWCSQWNRLILVISFLVIEWYHVAKETSGSPFRKLDKKKKRKNTTMAFAKLFVWNTNTIKNDILSFVTTKKRVFKFY